MLQEATITVPLAGNLDTKVDPKVAPVGDLVTLENAVFTSPGKIRKRYGGDAILADVQTVSVDLIVAGSSAMDIAAAAAIAIGNNSYTRTVDGLIIVQAAELAAQHAYALGDYAYVPTAAGSRGYLLLCTTAGTTGSAWAGGSATLGADLTDGAVKWAVVGSGGDYHTTLTVTCETTDVVSLTRGSVAVEDPTDPGWADIASIYEYVASTSTQAAPITSTAMAVVPWGNSVLVVDGDSHLQLKVGEGLVDKGQIPRYTARPSPVARNTAVAQKAPDGAYCSYLSREPTFRTSQV